MWYDLTMKNGKNVFDIFVKVCSVLVLVLGFLLILYIYFGPSLGLIDAESASWGIVVAFPVILIGIISTVLSFTGHAKSSAVAIVLLILVMALNIWNGRRLSSSGIPTTPGGLRLQPQTPQQSPAIPNSQ